MLFRAVLAASLIGSAAPAAAEPAPEPEPEPEKPAPEKSEPEPKPEPEPEPEPAKPKPAVRGLEVRASGRNDPYGRRPEGVPKLRLSQIIRYALDNPLVLKAEQEIEEMRARVRKADFAWVPIIETQMLLMPGVRVRCQDVQLDNGTADPFDFQFCYTGENAEDRDFNINTVGDYFAQLADAGVRFEFRADTIFPITTFGKIRNTKRAARAALAVRKLKKLQVEQETMLRVRQAHNALLLARQSLDILREARKVVNSAVRRVEKDLGGGEDDWDSDDAEINPDRDPDDLYRVRLAEVEVEKLTRQALNVESQALTALWALAGRAAPRGFDIDETQLSVAPIDGGLQELDDYKKLAITQRPEARMASAGVKARDYQERLARANFLPDLGVVLRFAYARSTSADDAMNQIYYTNGFNYSRLTAALGLRWKWDFHNKAFDLQAARATRRAAEYQEEAARLLLGRDVEKAYGDLIEAKHVVQGATQAADLSWKLVVSFQQKDTVGGGDASELLRALKQWYEKRFELAEAIQFHNDALARLSRAVGTALSSPEPLPTGP